MSTREKVNKIAAYSIEGNVYFLAATNYGGYLSINAGSSWVEAHCGKTFYDADISTLPVSTITPKFNLYCNDNTINYFYTTNIKPEFRWFFNYIKYPLQNSNSIPTSYCKISNKDYFLQACNSSDSSALGMSNNSNSRPYSKYKLFNENMGFSSGLIIENDKNIPFFIAGSKKGIYISRDEFSTWNTYLANKNIHTLVYYAAASLIFAGADDGLFVSSDYGISWNRLFESEISTKVLLTAVSGNRLYFVTGNGDTYYFKIPSSEKKTLYKPELVNPKNNSFCSKNPTLTWIQTDEPNSVTYNLQISENNLFNKIIIDTTIKTDSFKTNLTESKKYYWMVRSKKIWGVSLWSDLYCFTIEQ